MSTFGAAVLGALVGSVFAWLTTRGSAQATTVFEFHRQYFGDLVEVREQAIRFIRKYPDQRLDHLWQTVDQREMQPLWEIVYFYERLWAAFRFRRVKRKIALDLFGASFNYWYMECFEDRLVPLADPIAVHIGDLHERMLRRARRFQVRRGAKNGHDAEGWDTYRRLWQLPAGRRGTEPT